MKTKTLNTVIPAQYDPGMYITGDAIVRIAKERGIQPEKHPIATFIRKDAGVEKLKVNGRAGQYQEVKTGPRMWDVDSKYMLQVQADIGLETKTVIFGEQRIVEGHVQYVESPISAEDYVIRVNTSNPMGERLFCFLMMHPHNMANGAGGYFKLDDPIEGLQKTRNTEVLRAQAITALVGASMHEIQGLATKFLLNVKGKTRQEIEGLLIGGINQTHFPARGQYSPTSIINYLKDKTLVEIARVVDEAITEGRIVRNGRTWYHQDRYGNALDEICDAQEQNKLDELIHYLSKGNNFGEFQAAIEKRQEEENTPQTTAEKVAEAIQLRIIETSGKTHLWYGKSNDLVMTHHSKTKRENYITKLVEHFEANPEQVDRLDRELKK